MKVNGTAVTELLNRLMKNFSNLRVTRGFGLKTIHLMHKFKIGGVEEAVLSAGRNTPEGTDFIVAVTDKSLPSVTLDSKPIINPYSKWNPLGFIFIVKTILKENPDILVCSLWRSIAAGIVIKLIGNNITTIFFFHNEKFNHILDKIFSLLGIHICDRLFADSEKTKQFIGGYTSKKIEVISFVIRKPGNNANVSRQTLSFVFFGRLNKQKRLDKAMELIYLLKGKYKSKIIFQIIGPNEGMLPILKKIASNYGIDDDVQFSGPKSFQEIQEACKKATFYLQLSDHEGMGMSVIEAMQMGLIPIVTPVGEIKNYVKHMKNGIIYQTLSDTIESIDRLVNDNALLVKLSQNSLFTFYNKPTYSESFFQKLGK